MFPINSFYINWPINWTDYQRRASFITRFSFISMFSATFYNFVTNFPPCVLIQYTCPFVRLTPDPPISVTENLPDTQMMKLAWRIITSSQIISILCLHARCITLGKNRGSLSVADVESSQSVARCTPSKRYFPRQTHSKIYLQVMTLHSPTKQQSQMTEPLNFRPKYGTKGRILEAKVSW